MPHETPLIALISLGLVFAFGFGFLAQRLRLPPLVGYLLAGVAVGPFTPGFVADAQGVAHHADRELPLSQDRHTDTLPLEVRELGFAVRLRSLGLPENQAREVVLGYRTANDGIAAFDHRLDPELEGTPELRP